MYNNVFARLKNELGREKKNHKTLCTLLLSRHFALRALLYGALLAPDN